jgi:hypothetical protein
MRGDVSQSEPIQTRRQIERDRLARQAILIHRLNVTTAVMLCLVLISLIAYFVCYNSAVYEVAHQVWLFLGDVAGFTSPAPTVQRLNVTLLPPIRVFSPITATGDFSG